MTARLINFTAPQLSKFGTCFQRAFQVDQSPSFDDLLKTIDRADDQLQSKRVPREA